jgi:integrase
MAVFKRYKGKRITPGHKEWAKANWWMEFTLRGNYVLQSIPGARTRAQAERAENNIRESIYNGKFNKGCGTERFSDFVDTIYLPWAKANKRSYGHDNGRAVVLKEFFGNRQLRDITPMLIEKMKSDLLGAKTHVNTARKGSTVNRYLQLLSKIFSMAYDNGLIDTNPCRRVRKEKEGGRRERYLTYDEEARLMEALTGDLAYLKPAIVTALGTGMRKSEQLRMRVEHINFGSVPVFYPVHGKEIQILPNWMIVADSKSKKPRTIPMNPAVRTTLLASVQDAPPTDCVFTYARTGISDQTIRTGFKKACSLAGIPCGQAQPGGLVWHDLRHTFATRLREQGVHELDIMQLMGHSSVMMTSSYAHGTPHVIQGAVDRLTRRRGEVVEFGRKVG